MEHFDYEKPLRFHDFQQESTRHVIPHDNRIERLDNWVYGLAGEIGEFIDGLKHPRFYAWNKNEVFSKEHAIVSYLVKEMGDILWYMSNICNTLDLDLETIAKINILKLRHRYETEFDIAVISTRTEKEEQLAQLPEYIKLMGEVVKDVTKSYHTYRSR